jgi:hypothetical protein
MAGRGDDPYPFFAGLQHLTIADDTVYAWYSPIIGADDLTAGLGFQFGDAGDVVPMGVGGEELGESGPACLHCMKDRRAIARVYNEAPVFVSSA